MIAPDMVPSVMEIDSFSIKDPRFTYPYKAMGKANETIIDKKQTQHP